MSYFAHIISGFLENTYAVNMAFKMKLKSYAALVGLWHVNSEKSSFYRMAPSDFIFAKFHPIYFTTIGRHPDF